MRASWLLTGLERCKKIDTERIFCGDFVVKQPRVFSFQIFLKNNIEPAIFNMVSSLWTTIFDVIRHQEEIMCLVLTYPSLESSKPESIYH